MNVFQERCLKIFAGDVAQRYPTKAEGSRYDLYNDLIKKVCSFKSNNLVLELCCGTAKYFHMIENLEMYVGVDLSPDMLRQADKHINGNCILIESPIESFESMVEFDFVFSIGTIGEYLPLTKTLLSKMLSWVAPKGCMFFTVVDKEYFKPKPDLTYDWSACYLTYNELDTLLRAVPNINYSITRHEDNKHIHLICKIQRS